MAFRRHILVLAALTAALAPVASAVPSPLPVGYVEATPCQASGVGLRAHIDTAWELVYVASDAGSASFEMSGPTFAGAVLGPCTTATCAQASLYANGRLVARSPWVC